jgi:endonuclease/exonuclease/phosphatase family metal-dependent hydrolase
MKVLTWNMGYWLHREAHGKAWNFLLNEIQPDIALLQETKPPTNLEKKSILFKPVRDWGTGLFSTSVIGKEIPLNDYPGRVAAAKIESLGSSIVAISIHAPIIRNRVFPHLDKIFDAVEHVVGDSSFIVGGDLNSARF